MNALEALHTRSSSPRLSEPIPDQHVLDNIYKAAFRAADHALLRPWRFLLIKDSALDRLADLFVSAAESVAVAQDTELSDEQRLKIRRKTQRAPLILVAISSFKPHPKVPQIEQDLSAGAAAQNMLLAAFAQGVGAMWRTGAMAYDQSVMTGLGLSSQEKIIGFLYLGTIKGGSKQLIDPNVDEYFQEW